ncbi:formate hydrogenlyase maturation HycH family protein [Acerihabitans sp. KWT182]|uniref:Formate hydrogenlyase maturation HycH family protein n=1 Tax=Acerihabitans sp. KWT182 TaxID=3157919 RepID=A0AAU7QCS1_9GAMM
MADVYIWSLRQKFLDSDDDMPPQTRQVMYYSLAIGHHVGVIDCLNKELVCPLEQYRQWLELLPEGEARRKMHGLLTFGEIIIDSTHTDLLANALAPLQSNAPAPYNQWSARLMALLGEISREPAIYLIVRRV